MQPDFDSWDFEAPPAETSDPAIGLVDISKGKGKDATASADTWDSWDTGGAPGDTPGDSDVGSSGFDADISKGSWGGGSKGNFGGKGDFGTGAGGFDGFDSGKNGKGNFKGGFKGGKNGYDNSGWNSSWSGSDSGFGGKGDSNWSKGKGDSNWGKGKADWGKGSVVTPPGMDGGKGDSNWGGKSKMFGGKGDGGKGKGRMEFQPAPRLPSYTNKGDDGKSGDAGKGMKGGFCGGPMNACKGGSGPAAMMGMTGPAPVGIKGGPGMMRPAQPAPLRPLGGSYVMPPGPGMKGGKAIMPPPNIVQPPPRALMPPPGAMPGPGGLAPELQALIGVGGGDVSAMQHAPMAAPHVTEKKPRIVLLITRLSPDLQETHMQQILDQCGEVQAWRRARGASGEPLSFGFAQFGDPEAAWKVSTCLSKKVLCGQEIKILIEEQAESLIQAWRSSQQAALKVNSDEELEWELERKAVSCKALIEAKVEEFYGSPAEEKNGDDGTGGAGAQRRQEILDREQARLDRAKKRKAYHDSEFAKELARIEEMEKTLRREEREKDDEDREAEEREVREKEAHEVKLAKMEEVGVGGSVLETVTAADAKAIYELVDRVQGEPQNELFKMELDVAFLRDEKIFEKKLRPWLERKVDLFLGGPQSDLVEYILRRVNAAAFPDALISEIHRFLDDNAEILVERMWRMLVLELTRGGLGLSSKAKKSRLE